METSSTFLSLLDPTTDQFLFCCLHEKDKSKQPQIYKGSLANYHELLTQLNSQGYGIFVAINSQDGKARKKENMLRPRALYQDDDKGFKGEYPIKPNLVVNTSPGKYQRYWLLDEPAWDKSLWPEYEAVLQTLVSKYGNDPSTKDSSRVFRVPGFNHMKGEPHLVTLSVEHELYYTFNQVKEAFPVVNITKLVSKPSPVGEHKLSKAVSQVLSGENFNDALGTLSMWYIDKGLPRDFILSTLYGYMEQSQDKGSDRWQQRVEHLPKQVDAGIKKKSKEALVFPPRPDFNSLDPNICSDLPWPEGLLGLLAQDIHDSMRNPERNIALLGAIHIFSTFAGRSFQFELLGLTAKRLLIAKSSRGKNIIKSYFGSLITLLSKPGPGGVPLAVHANLFMSSGKITTGSTLQELLQECAHRSFILSESGLANSDKSDYSGGLKSAIMQLLSEQQDSALVPENQRHNKLEPVYERCAVFLDESTIHSVMSHLQDTTSWLDGEFTRIDIVFADPIISPPNRNAPKHKKNTEVVNAIASLVRMNTVTEQAYKGTSPLPDADIREVEIEDDAWDFFAKDEDDRIEILNEPGCPVHKEALYNRRIPKMKVYATIYAIADAVSQGGDLHNVRIQLKHAEWARKLMEEFARPLLKLAEDGLLSAPDEQFFRLLEEGLVRMLVNQRKDEPMLSSLNLVTRSKYSTNMSRKIKAFTSSNPTVRMDLDRGLQELANRGIIKEVYPKDLEKYINEHPVLKYKLIGKVYQYQYDVMSVKLEQPKRRSSEQVQIDKIKDNL